MQINDLSSLSVLIGKSPLIQSSLSLNWVLILYESLGETQPMSLSVSRKKRFLNISERNDLQIARLVARIIELEVEKGSLLML